ncbi:MAG: hypothetical protein P4N60_13365 [Verrucomicrobiae bacterium]|nr:hypothetical protein [Verrucomicrobiae bacterium]
MARKKNLFSGSGIFRPGSRLSLGRRGFGLWSLIALLPAVRLFLATGFIPTRIVPARFIPPGLVAAWFVTPRLIAPWIALRLLHLPGRLDAAEGAAELINLAFIGQLLALGEFNQLQDLIQLVDRVLERLGDFGRLQHRLMDGGSGGGPEIGGLHPLTRALRFLPALR